MDISLERIVLCCCFAAVSLSAAANVERLAPCEKHEDCVTRDPQLPVCMSQMCLPCESFGNEDYVRDVCPKGTTETKDVVKQEQDESPTVNIGPCQEESDCDIGFFCLRGTGTCEDCRTLQDDWDVYNNECRMFIETNEIKHLAKLDGVYVIGLCTAGAVIIVLLLVIIYLICKRFPRPKPGMLKNGDRLQQPVDV